MAEKTINEGRTERANDSIGVVFEHLFPGNRYTDLKGQCASLTSRGDLFRTSAYSAAVATGNEYVEREEVDGIDKPKAARILSGLIPTASPHHPSYYKGRSFTDVVKVSKGEKLGGASERTIDVFSAFPPAPQFTVGLESTFKKPEIVLGVLDKQGKPKAIIHYIEGSGKKSEVVSRVPVKGKLVGSKIPV